MTEGGRCLDSITDSMDMNLSKLQEIAENRGAWCAAVHGVTKNQTQLSELIHTRTHTHTHTHTHTPRRVGGLLGVAGRLSGTVSPLRAEQGSSLETPSRARVASVMSNSLRPHGL